MIASMSYFISSVTDFIRFAADDALFRPFSAITVSFGAVRFAFSHPADFSAFLTASRIFFILLRTASSSFSSCFADGTYSIFIFIFINDSFEGKSANKNRLRTVSGARGGQSAVPLLICRFIPVTQARVGTAAAHGRTAGSFRSIAFSIREPLCPKIPPAFSRSKPLFHYTTADGVCKPFFHDFRKYRKITRRFRRIRREARRSSE